MHLQCYCLVMCCQLNIYLIQQIAWAFILFLLFWSTGVILSLLFAIVTSLKWGRLIIWWTCGNFWIQGSFKFNYLLSILWTLLLIADWDKFNLLDMNRARILKCIVFLSFRLLLYQLLTLKLRKKCECFLVKHFYSAGRGAFKKGLLHVFMELREPLRFQGRHILLAVYLYSFITILD